MTLRPDTASPPTTGRDGPASGAGQPRKEAALPRSEAGSGRRPTQQAILEAYAEALAAAKKTVTGDPEMMAFLMVGFKFGLPLEDVKDAVIADQFNLGAG